MEVQQVGVQGQIKYAEAVKMVNHSGGADERSSSRRQTSREADRPSEGK